MPATERGFLRAIAKEPDSDELRLIFADYLQDHGKPAWAALIREQITRSPTDPDRLHACCELAPIPLFMFPVDSQIEREMEYPVPIQGAVFRRGLLDHLTLPMEELLEVGEELTGWGPVPMLQPTSVALHLDTIADWTPPRGLSRLNLTRGELTDENLLILLSSEWFAGLEELSLARREFLIGPRTAQEGSNHFTTATGGLLAKATGLRALRRLDLRGVMIGDEGLLRLTLGPTLRSLTWLGLGGCGITGTAFSAFESVPWPHLEILDLYGNPLTTEGANLLAQSPQLEPVRQLILGGTNFPDGSASLLSQSPHLLNLRELNLSRSRIRETGFIALAESPALTGLRKLSLPKEQNRLLSYPEFGPRRAAALARATFADTLEELDLRFQPVGDAVAIALAESGRYGRLKKLSLEDCRIGPAGARALLGWERSKHIDMQLDKNPLGPDGVELVVRSCCLHLLPGETASFELAKLEFDDEGIFRLVQLPQLASCSELSLSDNEITFVGVETLASCPAIGRLERLDLANVSIGDAGVVALATSPHLSRLKILWMTNCGITDAGVHALVNSASLRSLESLILFGNPLTDAAAFALAEGKTLLSLKHLQLDQSNFGVSAQTALRNRFGEALSMS